VDLGAISVELRVKHKVPMPPGVVVCDLYIANSDRKLPTAASDSGRYGKFSSNLGRTAPGMQLHRVQIDFPPRLPNFLVHRQLFAQETVSPIYLLPSP